MGTRTIIWIVGCGFAGAALWNDKETMAAVFGTGTVLAVSIHHLEVKLNKLLDERGIIVTDRELRD